jgi:hypothetical protein
MPSYLVTWSIDIDNVNDEREAAEEALKIMMDPESRALRFQILRPGTKRTVAVDLDDEETVVEQLRRAARRKT